ncbi:Non-reducing end beta-L-arabinofuranosidase [Dyadobacter sp. CECT 9623]|uniref:Non-reducing end beta-L-arabinofuranosidase n=1 Tax=Dyadobacter linearis TaxID=2823330 RepID=A0ABM8UNI2_9BACT|nr:glycoside hydrolase family 127 protein [Dyadobacter sp. CECT 9623]CAG5068966.1 Non-reducing end beta-L-arabinofuranosidase [Dyadobacter sp. CECT 9623]
MKNFRRLLFIPFAGLALTQAVFAQENALVNTSRSTHAKLHGTDMNAVEWTTGFWADRFKVCRETMVPNLWKVYTDPELSHSFRNFEIAAGLKEGNFKGPSFHDGDFYKTFEAVAGMYAATKDPKLDALMDHAIEVMAKAQRADGYIYTKAIIQQKQKGEAKMFDDRLSFEAYNFGHLMTAACVHYRATGKSTLMNVAKKASDFLIGFYANATPEQSRNAICPSHYMGLSEMYRTTRDEKYLKLVKHLIAIKGATEGTDDNQDRIPFLKQTKVMGHAVRANYLYAGVADVYAETGDQALMDQLNVMWDDVTNHKMYVTGGCGALYDGVSPDGTSYKPDEVQKIHQSYGRDYQLPNFTAHNETCANIGNVLWNWRMLQITGDAKYADIVELALYNSVLSGINLQGDKFLYTNPLAYSDALPFKQRWEKERLRYISKSNCCPPNTVRTVSEVNQYVYSVSDAGVFFNLYGGNELDTRFKNGVLRLSQTTDYPWDGKVSVQVEEAPSNAFAMFFRIPGWCSGATLAVNGKKQTVSLNAGTYAEVERAWKKGDKVELLLPMPVKLIESNPLVEETRNQVAVKRGPIVYCVESMDLPKGKTIFDVAVSVNNNFKPTPITIENSPITALQGDAVLLDNTNWSKKLYREVSIAAPKTIPVKLVPYYAWGNRGHGEMSVWLPLVR